MEQISNDLNQERDPIAEKLADTPTMEKIFKQAVFEAVDKAQRLGFLPMPAPLTTSEDQQQ